MKKLWTSAHSIALGFLLGVSVMTSAIWYAVPSKAQTVSYPMSGSGAPSGNCTSQSAYGWLDTNSGNWWTCKGGVWALAGNPASLPISCTTGSIGGSLLAVGASASGTASCTGATTGMVCQAQASDGTNMAALGASPMCTVTASGVATVNLVAIILLTPTAKTYTVRVFP
jgi:hypothetical protein